MATQIAAETTVSAPPAQVFAFLADLRNHWELEGRFVALGGLDGEGEHGPTGGRICIKGPLGLSREATTRVLAAEAPADERPGRLSGSAHVGAATVGRVQWELRDAGRGRSLVRLSATVERASALDRVLLAAGGASWLRRIFGNALRNLDVVVREQRA